MKLKLLSLACGGLLSAGCQVYDRCPAEPSDCDLVYSSLAGSWDEGIPLGNATVGALVWKKDSALRFSLDRTDLWDLRPSDSLAGSNYRFAWVKEQIRKKEYLPVQKKFDWPYNSNPAPSKLPGAAVEFPLAGVGEPTDVRLYLDKALCEVSWGNGMQMHTFVHAVEPVGWFVFRNLPVALKPVIVPPVYHRAGRGKTDNSHAGADLQRLGYEQGDISEQDNRIVYRQPGWGGFYYEAAVVWRRKGNTLYGAWSVTSSLSGGDAAGKAEAALSRGLAHDYRTHGEYWSRYWARSSVSLPDPVLQKQYRNEMYKFGSVAREHAYPISLQAVWTADNGRLPPWKGDYHHDLNTQLSYWPAYTGNRLQEGSGYLNTLWNQRETYERFTRQYFGTGGMNIPGVATLTGEPMGGWVQYSMSQTTAAWLAQHFYLHWKYSADRTFLQERAYPFIKEVAVYLEQISAVGADGVRRLEFSSSPEIFDNSLQAWFTDMTNYDLALMRFLFDAAAELAGELNLADEAARWRSVGKQLPGFDLDADGALTFAKGFPYQASHRHFSHAMAIHPLGLVDWSDGEEARKIIRATLKKLDDYGSDYWTGYSYSWLANLKARAFDGEGAAEALRIFAECFCLKNTFHANGDQSRSGKSRFTYRPFTLEGNFAFAAGVQEMLLQSHTGVVRVFPAVPAAWQEVSFRNLRATGAFLVSAQREKGKLTRVEVYAEKGGTLKMIRPGALTPDKPYKQADGGVWLIETRAGDRIEWR